jgi:hypothetical protein
MKDGFIHQCDLQLNCHCKRAFLASVAIFQMALILYQSPFELTAQALMPLSLRFDVVAISNWFTFSPVLIEMRIGNLFYIDNSSLKPFKIISQAVKLIFYYIPAKFPLDN